MNKKIITAFALIGLAAFVCQTSADIPAQQDMQGSYEYFSQSHKSAVEEAFFSDCEPETLSCRNCCSRCCIERKYTSGEQSFDLEDQSPICHCTRAPAQFQPEIGPVYDSDHVMIDMSAFD